ncbi:MAG: hypothetical protein Q9217_005805 [Psora testacea]
MEGKKTGGMVEGSTIICIEWQQWHWERHIYLGNGLDRTVTPLQFITAPRIPPGRFTNNGPQILSYGANIPKTRVRVRQDARYYFFRGAKPSSLSDDEGLASDDTDSYLGDASCISLATSINHYKLENNRRYHTYRDGSYWAPHDKEAVELDTIADFADKFPDADIIATDLARVQEDHASPNLRFEVDDCCSDWIYPLDHFDYIHVRLLYGSVADWDALYRQCYDHLAPGGYLEQAEICPVLESDDSSIPPGSVFEEGGRLALECGVQNGKPMDIQRHIKGWITKAGFVDVVEEKYKWPIGDWPADSRLKDIGRWNATHWNLGIEAWSMRLLTQCHGVSMTPTSG